MEKDIKIGDSVYLINGNGVFTIEKNKQYIVTDIKTNRFHDKIISVSSPETTYVGDYYYNVSRFTKNIRPIRKEKLKQIFNETKRL